MVTKLSLSQACEGMIRYKMATGKSKHTISDYRSSFKKLFLFFPDDPQFTSISRQMLIEFFAWLQDGYKTTPDGVAPRGTFKLAPKSILNIHINLSSLWTWAVDEGLVKENIVRRIATPPVEPPVIEPFTKDDIALLLKACSRSRTWKTNPSVSNSRPTADRDKAIIAVLLDTGIRASELCSIRFGDINIKANQIRIYGKGAGRDKKERFVYFGRRTSQLIWKYLLPRMEDIREDDSVFVVGPLDFWQPMNRSV
jgi:integrase/recombinase XerD